MFVGYLCTFSAHDQYASIMDVLCRDLPSVANVDYRAHLTNIVDTPLVISSSLISSVDILLFMVPVLLNCTSMLVALFSRLLFLVLFMIRLFRIW